MEAINLDLLPGAIPPIVHVSQGDVGRKFAINIYDDTGAAYSLTGKNLSIVGHKEDGNVFQYDISSSAVSTNTVTITTEDQMTTTAGKVLCEIRIEYDGTKLGTCNFVMDVEQGPADLGTVSKSTLYFIDVLFEKAKEYTDAAAASAATATQKATEAANSATNAASSARSADSSATDALKSARDAATRESTASYYMSEAQKYSENANNAATNAASSADEASVSANDAADSASSASNYMSSAHQYSEDAGNSATNAASSANNAAASATAAAKSATAAESSEQIAIEKADTAVSSANNAANSASSASTSANNAAASANAAANSATNAKSSEQVATEKANIASTSANNAYKSASAANTSATNAAASANAAANSETNAESSEQIATEKANAAVSSATNAANSASAASTSETNAAKSATAAAKSSEDASAKASAANQSAINAASSKDSAATSATAAEAAKNRIENMTVSAQSVPYTSQAEVTKSIVNDIINLDFKIPKGQPMSGHEVVANPAGSATGGDLTKLDIDGTVYNVSGMPDYSQASDGDVLTKTAQGPAWSAPSGGGSNIKLLGISIPVVMYINNTEITNFYEINISMDSAFKSYYENDMINNTAIELISPTQSNQVLITGKFKSTAYYSPNFKNLLINDDVLLHDWIFTTYPPELKLFLDQNGNWMIPQYINISINSNNNDGVITFEIIASDWINGIYGVKSQNSNIMIGQFGGILVLDN